jgi:excinuclease UvrABC nuclease subunit
VSDIISTRLRQAHDLGQQGTSAVMRALAEHDPEFMNSTLSEMEAAAKHFEEAARHLRDQVAVIRAHEEHEDN